MINSIFSTFKKLTLSLLLIFFGTMNLGAQTASYRCFCDGSIPDGVLGFEININNSPINTTWTIDNVINLYGNINPMILLQNGTELDEDPMDNTHYSLHGYALDGQMPFVTVRNQSGMVFDMNMVTCFAPSGDISGDDEVCTGGQANLVFTVNTPNILNNSISWNAPGAVSVTPSGADNLNLALEYDTPGTYIVSVEGLSTSMCEISDNFSITVFDAAEDMFISGPDYLCSADAADIPYTVTNPYNLITLQWTSDIGGVTFVPNLGDPMTGSGSMVEATFSGAGMYTLMVTNFDPDGCTLDGVDYVVNVVDVIDTIAIIGDTYVCLDETANYTISMPSDYSNLDWSIMPAVGVTMTPANGESDVVSIEYTTPGDYVLTLTGMANSGCDILSTLDIVVPGSDIGTIACNNLVNVSLNNNCILELLPEMILEGVGELNDAYTLIIVDATTGIELVGNMVNQDQLGHEFIVTVIEECGGNSCWGRLLVEDKSIPSIVPFCEDMPIATTCVDINSNPSLPIGFPDFGPGSNSIYNANLDNWLVSGFDACNDVVLSYEDVYADADICADPQVITRKWSAVDVNNGAKTTCTVTINVSLIDVQSIVWPFDYDSGLNSDAPGDPDTDRIHPSLDACNLVDQVGLLNGTRWTKDSSGNPSIQSTGSPMSDAFSCPNLQVIGYKDRVLPLCGSAKKILREWTVWDACEMKDTKHTQIITLMDVIAPICVAPAERQVYTDIHECGADITIEPPTVIGECDAYTYTVKYKTNKSGNLDLSTFTDFNVYYDNSLKRYIIRDVEFKTDTIWVNYIIRDACGNVTNECVTELELIDNEQPIPACDFNTVVTLNSQGYAFAGPATFDDHSWDNCGVYQTVIQKMDDQCNCHPATFDFLYALGEFNGHRYYLSKEKMNASKAFGLAEALDGYAAVVNSSSENDWINDKVNIITNEGYTIGLSGKSTSQLNWINGDNSSYRNWDASEPSLSGGKGDVHVFVNDDGTWDAERRNRFETYYVLELENACEWSQKVSFCCADVGQETRVALRVIDWHGNHNLCMVNIRVMEFEDPVITCPDDVRIDCQENFDINDLSIFGTATATDNCGVEGITESNSSLNSQDCGQGFLTRTFTAKDYAGNKDVCTQKITLQATRVFQESDIRWPMTHNEKNRACTLKDISPDITGRPTWNASAFPCSNITSAHSDLLFLIADGVCQKLVRTWTVIDWCQGNKIWEYSQVIKMTNTIAPTISSETCRNLTVSNGQKISSCLVQVNDLLAGLDPNSNSCGERAQWSYTIDYNDDGSIDKTGNTANASGSYPYGSHRIKWTVIDDCKNVSSCDKVIIVRDNLPPTPYCHSEIVIPISDPLGVEIWASDLNLGSFDDCPTNQVYFSFAENTSISNRLLTCADLDTNSNFGYITIPLWVRDNFENGLANKSVCNVRIILQDNSNVCDNIGTGNSISKVSGYIRTEVLEMVDNVEMSIGSSQMESEMMSTTGEFAFENLAMYNDYQVNAYKNDDLLNGVSTLDLVLIQRHILGLQKLDSPYKIIAADVDGSGTISAIDLIHLRKLILGIYEELPNNNSWRFIDSEFTFVDPLSPFPFNENVEINNLSKDIKDADFVGVKIGDVNGSVVSGLQSTTLDSRTAINTLEIEVSNSLTPKGNQRMQFIARESGHFLGAQMALQFNSNESELLAMVPMSLDVANDHVAWNKTNDGVFALSWTSQNAINVSKGDVLFELLFKGDNANVILNKTTESFSPEIYTLSIGKVEVNNVIFIGNDALEFEFSVSQNIPNPFKDATSIQFVLEKPGDVILTVTDQTGRLLHKQQGFYTAGNNEITLNSESINGTGLMYYQISTESHTATRKMILLN